MESKRAGDSIGATPRTPTKKPKSTSRVKVVASRYAQALQSKNLESRARTASFTSATGTATTRAPHRSSSTHASTGAAARSGAVASARTKTLVTPSAHALTMRAQSVATAANAPAAPTPSSRSATPSATTSVTPPPPPTQDLKERLKAYKANKALLAQAATASSPALASAAIATPVRDLVPTKPKPVVKPVPKPAAKPHTVRERLGFPKRVSVTERSTKRPTKVASDPIPTEMTVVTSTRPLSAGTTPRARTVTHSSTMGATASQTEDDERELLDASYVQLCYVEMQADAAFRAQEQAAERQLLAAWHVLESKLQLLHDTSLRLDREQHIRRLETNTLLRSVAALETELAQLLQHIEATHVDATVADAVAFERGMAHAADAASASLLQVAHLVDTLVRDVTTETSSRIAQIQHQRLDAMAAAIITSDTSVW